jgi:hypothetical protein
MTAIVGNAHTRAYVGDRCFRVWFEILVTFQQFECLSELPLLHQLRSSIIERSLGMGPIEERIILFRDRHSLILQHAETALTSAMLP